MSKVVFHIDFMLEGKVQLTGRGGISHAQASQIQGLCLTSQDTIIRFDHDFVEPEPKRRGKKPKQQQHRSSAGAPSEPPVDDEDDDDDMKDLQEIEKQIEDRMMEQEFNSQEDSMNDDDMDVEQDDDQNDSNNEERIVMAYNQKRMTKRQLGYLEQPMQLPDKISRQRRKQDGGELDGQKKLEKEERRRQHMRKMMEAQKMETLDKILNETGRKQRQRTEKQNKERAEKQNKIYRQLGDVPKSVTRWDSEGCHVTLYDTYAFPITAQLPPRTPMTLQCSQCGQPSRYKLKNGKSVCSMKCYKKH